MKFGLIENFFGCKFKTVTKLYSTKDVRRLSELKSILCREGISSVITLGDSSPFVTPPGPLAFLGAGPTTELCITREEDLPKATELLKSWLVTSESAVQFWQCPQCHEKLESEFDSCWKCGTKK